MRSDAEIEDAMERYGDAVLRTCSAYLTNRHDAEDAFQDTFVRFATGNTRFNDEDHRKAWLIRVSINICKDRLKSSAMRTAPLEESDEMASSDISEQEVSLTRMHMRAALDELPEDNRVALVLSVVEGYSAQEIADYMGKPVNTVYSLITRGKDKLRKVLGND